MALRFKGTMLRDFIPFFFLLNRLFLVPTTEAPCEQAKTVPIVKFFDFAKIFAKNVGLRGRQWRTHKNFELCNLHVDIFAEKISETGFAIW